MLTAALNYGATLFQSLRGLSLPGRRGLVAMSWSAGEGRGCTSFRHDLGIRRRDCGRGRVRFRAVPTSWNWRISFRTEFSMERAAPSTEVLNFLSSSSSISRWMSFLTSLA